MSTRETVPGLGVKNFYGPRSVPEGNAGTIKTEGGLKELSVEITGDQLSTSGQVDVVVIPAGSRVKDAYFEVEEAFALGGTSPTINVGTSGSEATNGASLTEARAEAVGTYLFSDSEVSLNGTWANALAANTTVGVALGGTSPTSTSAGKARLVIQYVKV